VEDYGSGFLKNLHVLSILYNFVIKMMGDFIISEKSKLINQKVDEIEKKFNVQILQLKEGLPPKEDKERIMNPPKDKRITSGLYIKVLGSYRDVLKVLKAASC